MACKCEEEFNPWPAFVDIFSSVILVLLLFILVIIVNLAYQAQFKFRVSYTGTLSRDDVILNNNKTEKDGEPDSKEKNDPKKAVTNSNINLQIIKEEEQFLLLLKKQTADSNSESKGDKTSEIESPGVDVADKDDLDLQSQEITSSEDYMIITYKGDEVFIDDGTTKKLKEFLSQAKSRLGNHEVYIFSSEIKEQLSATIAKQISLARTLSTRNLIRKLGYDKKDVKVDLLQDPNIKEKPDDKNGYLVIKVKK